MEDKCVYLELQLLSGIRAKPAAPILFVIQMPICVCLFSAAVRPACESLSRANDIKSLTFNLKGLLKHGRCSCAAQTASARLRSARLEYISISM